MSETRWLEIAVEVAGIDAEIAADVFRQACSGGAAIQSATRFDPTSDAYIVDGDASAVVRGYLPDDDEAARIRTAVRLALRMAPLQTAPRWRRVRRLKESNWRESWKKHFGVQRIGRALVVKPSWEKYRPKATEIVIEIDPGMAFGTGSTRRRRCAFALWKTLSGRGFVYWTSAAAREFWRSLLQSSEP